MSSSKAAKARRCGSPGRPRSERFVAPLNPNQSINSNTSPGDFEKLQRDAGRPLAAQGAHAVIQKPVGESDSQFQVCLTCCPVRMWYFSPFNIPVFARVPNGD